MSGQGQDEAERTMRPLPLSTSSEDLSCSRRPREQSVGETDVYKTITNVRGSTQQRGPSNER
jgi:hypothetical protein